MWPIALLLQAPKPTRVTLDKTSQQQICLFPALIPPLCLHPHVRYKQSEIVSGTDPHLANTLIPQVNVNHLVAASFLCKLHY